MHNSGIAILGERFEFSCCACADDGGVTLRVRIASARRINDLTPANDARFHFCERVDVGEGSNGDEQRLASEHILLLNDQEFCYDAVFCCFPFEGHSVIFDIGEHVSLTEAVTLLDLPLDNGSPFRLVFRVPGH